MAYDPQPTKTEGGQNKAIASDDDVKTLMLKILKELKKMNFHLSKITDSNISDTDMKQHNTRKN